MNSRHLWGVTSVDALFEQGIGEERQPPVVGSRSGATGRGPMYQQSHR
jgi:hypothetical protein